MRSITLAEVPGAAVSCAAVNLDSAPEKTAKDVRAPAELDVHHGQFDHPADQHSTLERRLSASDLPQERTAITANECNVLGDSCNTYTTTAPVGGSSSKFTETIEADKDENEQPIVNAAARRITEISGRNGDIRPRPLVCQDITNSGKDMLQLSQIPKGMTYDRLYNLVEPFGEVEELSWTASDPHICEVVYKDPSAVKEAMHFLGDALVAGNGEPPLKAELRSQDPGAQLFVGDLTPDVTEAMLENVFTTLVDSPVSAVLKRDPESFSPIGYGFLSFQNEASANLALVSGHRAKVGNANVRVGRAERNTHLYITDLAPDVSMDDLQALFGRFGNLVEEDTVIVRRSYAFIRYKNRLSAERAKRTLDKTELNGRITVRYAEAEPLKACVAVQFHSSVPRPPNSLRELLLATFSKFGNCSIEVPRLRNGMWRKVAFITFHGEPISAALAATEAVQSVRFVSTVPVCCQFARELIPRMPPRDLRTERPVGIDDTASRHLPPTRPPSGGGGPSSIKPTRRPYLGTRSSGPSRAVRDSAPPSHMMGAASTQMETLDTMTGRSPGHSGQNQQPHIPADFVPVYVPVSALHPYGIPQSQQHNVMPDGEFSPHGNWSNRMMIPLPDRAGAPGHTQTPANAAAPPQQPYAATYPNYSSGNGGGYW